MKPLWDLTVDLSRSQEKSILIRDAKVVSTYRRPIQGNQPISKTVLPVLQLDHISGRELGGVPTLRETTGRGERPHYTMIPFEVVVSASLLTLI